MTQAVTIREVNQHTSEVFRRVSAGEELVVTRAGRPQARIVPYQPQGTFERLVAEGRITPAKDGVVHIDQVYSVPIDFDAFMESERADEVTSWR